jgi:hypothetical protein
MDVDSVDKLLLILAGRAEVYRAWRISDADKNLFLDHLMRTIV